MVRADVLLGTEGHIDDEERLLVVGCTGVNERGTRTAGPPGTWEADESPREVRAGVPDTNSRLTVGCEQCQPWVSKQVLAARYRCAKATKQGGMGASESEPRVVPMKPANESPEELVEGRGGREDGTERRERCSSH